MADQNNSGKYLEDTDTSYTGSRTSQQHYSSTRRGDRNGNIIQFEHAQVPHNNYSSSQQQHYQFQTPPLPPLHSPEPGLMFTQPPYQMNYQQQNTTHHHQYHRHHQQQQQLSPPQQPQQWHSNNNNNGKYYHRHQDTQNYSGRRPRMHHQAQTTSVYPNQQYQLRPTTSYSTTPPPPPPPPGVNDGYFHLQPVSYPPSHFEVQHHAAVTQDEYQRHRQQHHHQRTTTVHGFPQHHNKTHNVLPTTQHQFPNERRMHGSSTTYHEPSHQNQVSHRTNSHESYIENGNGFGGYNPNLSSAQFQRYRPNVIGTVEGERERGAGISSSGGAVCGYGGYHHSGTSTPMTVEELKELTRQRELLKDLEKNTRELTFVDNRSTSEPLVQVSNIESPLVSESGGLLQQQHQQVLYLQEKQRHQIAKLQMQNEKLDLLEKRQIYRSHDDKVIIQEQEPKTGSCHSEYTDIRIQSSKSEEMNLIKEEVVSEESMRHAMRPPVITPIDPPSNTLYGPISPTSEPPNYMFSQLKSPNPQVPSPQERTVAHNREHSPQLQHSGNEGDYEGSMLTHPQPTYRTVSISSQSLFEVSHLPQSTSGTLSLSSQSSSGVNREPRIYSFHQNSDEPMFTHSSQSASSRSSRTMSMSPQSSIGVDNEPQMYQQNSDNNPMFTYTSQSASIRSSRTSSSQSSIGVDNEPQMCQQNSDNNPMFTYASQSTSSRTISSKSSYGVDNEFGINEHDSTSSFFFNSGSFDNNLSLLGSIEDSVSSDETSSPETDHTSSSKRHTQGNEGCPDEADEAQSTSSTQPSVTLAFDQSMDALKSPYLSPTSLLFPAAQQRRLTTTNELDFSSSSSQSESPPESSPIN